MKSIILLLCLFVASSTFAQAPVEVMPTQGVPGEGTVVAKVHSFKPGDKVQMVEVLREVKTGKEWVRVIVAGKNISYSKNLIAELGGSLEKWNAERDESIKRDQATLAKMKVPTAGVPGEGTLVADTIVFGLGSKRGQRITLKAGDKVKLVEVMRLNGKEWVSINVEGQNRPHSKNLIAEMGGSLEKWNAERDESIKRDQAALGEKIIATAGVPGEGTLVADTMTPGQTALSGMCQDVALKAGDKVTLIAVWRAPDTGKERVRIDIKGGMRSNLSKNLIAELGGSVEKFKAEIEVAH